MKLFPSRGATSPSREGSAEMDSRPPLSPISVRPRNKVVAHQPQQPKEVHHVHPIFGSPTLPAGSKKLTPSSLSQKKQGAEYGENIATFPPGTPEHKVAAPSAPNSSSKKRFGWSKQFAQQHEDLALGTVTSCAVLEAPTFASSALCSCSQYCAFSNGSVVGHDAGDTVESSGYMSAA